MRFASWLVVVSVVSSVLTQRASQQKEHAVSSQHDVQVAVIIAIKDAFHSGCVRVLALPAQTQQGAARQVGVAKGLSRAGVRAAHPGLLRARAMDARCADNRPLHVLLAVDDEALRSLRTEALPAYPRWLVFVTTSQAADTDALLRGVHVPFDAELLLASVDGDGVAFAEAYRVHRTGALLRVPFGRWSPSRGLVRLHGAASLYQRRNDLQGVILRTATVHSPPIIILRNDTDGNVRVGGYFGNIWGVLERRMNFSTEYQVPGDKGYGSLGGNGTWNGMIAMLLRDEADVAINDFLVTSSRMSAVDYILPIIFTSTQIFIHKPASLSLRWNNFLTPFSPRLWVALTEAVLVVSVVLALSCLVGRRCGAEDANSRTRFGLASSVFYVVGLFFQQGQDAAPRSLSARLVVLVAGVAALVLFAGYSASLISSLTVQTSELPFETFDQMLRDGSYKLGVQAKSGKLDLLQTTSNAQLRRLYERLVVKTSQPTTVREGLQAVCSRRKYAFLSAADVAVALSGELPCAIVPLPHAAIPDSSGMVLPKRSAYKAVFNHNLQFLRHAGILGRLRSAAWAQRPAPPQSDFEQVSLEAATPIFSVAVAGFVVGLLCCLAERLTRTRCTKRRAQPKHYARRAVVAWTRG